MTAQWRDLQLRAARMSLMLPRLEKVHVLVAGDVMLDRYWSGSTTRISPEAPVPIVNVQRTDHRAGGAANVALGLRALGAQATLIGHVGRDEAGDTLQGLLDAAGVRCALERQPGQPTIVKLRVLSQHQQMIRLDFESSAEAARALEAARIRPLLGPASAVVLSDYGKGALADAAELIAAARVAGKPVLVDPKQADFAVYRGASMLTPNRMEFERAAGRCRSDDELVERAQSLIERLELGGVLVTRGEEGMSLVVRGEPPLHVQAQAQEVFDVTGAGDTVIAVLAAAVAAGASWADAARLANVGAGIVVGKLGTATVSAGELRQALAASAG
jgi:D-beta-D-heptose 7-phosphate kinase/D-beta-D-heptose 1-phosphate adenosyltransferase